MADNDEKISFTLDLDAKAAVDAASHLKEQIINIGESKNLEGLISGLTKVSGLVGIIGAAVLAVGVSIEAVFEAEKIKQVNNQFEAMTKNLGLIGSKLKDDLVAATKGLVDETDALKAANVAMVQLGDGSSRIPEIMELARKSTALYGGEALDRFEQLTKAIASGQERQLKSLGIYIDSKKALQDYAKSLGVTADELSEAGKRQALLNAVLEKGKDAYKDVDESVVQATNSWKQAKVAFKDLGEAISLVIDKTIGPAIRSGITLFKDFATGFKDTVVSIMGDGADQTAAKTRLLTKEQENLKQAIDELDKSGRVFYNGTWVEKGTAFADNLQKRLSDINGQLQEINKNEQRALEGTPGGAEPTSGGSAEQQVDQAKKLANETKFQAELLRIKEEGLRSQMKSAETINAFEQVRLEEREIKEAQHSQKVAQIKATETLNERQKLELIEAENEAHKNRMKEFDIETLQNKSQMIEQEKAMMFDLNQFEEAIKQQKILEEQQYQMQREMLNQMKFDSDQMRFNAIEDAERQHQERLFQIDQQATQQREQLIDRWAAHSESAAGRFAKGFAAGSMHAMQNLKNFEKLGGMAFNSFGRHASNAFVQLGEGSKKGTDIMRGFFFGMLSDLAIQYGTFMLLSGIWPPNPPALAAGAALLVLGGMLKSLSGSGKTEAGGGVGGGGGIGDFSTTGATQNVADNQQQKKVVTLSVQGNYFETEQTKSRLIDLIREGTDATDFKYVQIGQT